MNDLISRKDAIDAVKKYYRAHDNDLLELIAFDIERLPSAQPERLTDDDFETIRIHLNAYKEKLCNQHRWEEAEEYQRIIDRFMSFASAQPVIRCKDCKHQVKEWRTDKRLKDNGYMVCGCEVVGNSCGFWALLGQDDDYCSYAERRTDGD